MGESLIPLKVIGGAAPQLQHFASLYCCSLLSYQGKAKLLSQSLVAGEPAKKDIEVFSDGPGSNYRTGEQHLRVVEIYCVAGVESCNTRSKARIHTPAFRWVHLCG